MAQIQIRDVAGAPISGINVRLALGHQSSDEAYDDRFTDLAGNTAWPNPLPSHDGYTLYVNHANVNPAFEQTQAHVPDLGTDVPFVLSRVPAQGQEQGFLGIDGRNFITDDGRPWQFRGYSTHYLPNCVASGYACSPIRDVLAQVAEYGYNTLVSVGMHASPWKVVNNWAFNPITHPDYFTILGQMFDAAEDAKLRVAHAPLADMQHLPANFDKQWFWRESCAVMKGRWNVLPRKGNEDYSNGWHPAYYHFPDMGGLLLSHGSRGEGTSNKYNPYFPYLNWVEYEVVRRAPKMFLDLPLRQMMDGDFAGPATNCPTVNIEPMYFADTNPDHVGDARSTDPRVALEMGVMMAACAGGAFGCSWGLECKVLPAGSISDQCAREFIRGLKAGFVRPLAALDFQGDH